MMAKFCTGVLINYYNLQGLTAVATYLYSLQLLIMIMLLVPLYICTLHATTVYRTNAHLRWPYKGIPDGSVRVFRNKHMR